MKKWETPELSNLTVANTNEGLCYCENGMEEEVITYNHQGQPYRPGHGHKPDRPGKPCPPTPCPPNNGGGDTGDTVIPQS